MLPCCPIRRGGLPVNGLPLSAHGSHRASWPGYLSDHRTRLLRRRCALLGELPTFPVDYVAQPLPHMLTELRVAGSRYLRRPLGRRLGRHAIPVGEFLT